MSLTRVVASAAFLCALSLSAQVQGIPAPSGTVTGHVTYGDTQRPARFAAVTLFGVPADATTSPLTKGDKDIKNLSDVMSAAFSGVTLIQAQTGLDGSFTATSVPPGDYYLFATVAGYLAPKNIIQAALDAGADMKKPLPGVPIVHVAADHTANGDLAMQRGASVSGTVRWDDGSPVSGSKITVVSVKGTEKDFPPTFAMLVGMGGAMGGGTGAGLLAFTDDLGHYRLPGLSPGDYYIEASVDSGGGLAMKNGAFNLSAAMHHTPLLVYAPATLHRADAKSVSLKTGEDRGDTDIVINLNATHTVSGHVASAEDHHALNAGNVTLTDTKDKNFKRSTGLDAQGNFTLTFVPAGTYDLAVTGGGDTEEPKKKSAGLFVTAHTVRSYEAGKSTVVVLDGDVSGQSLELTPSKKTSQDLDLNSVFGGHGASSKKEQ